MKKTLIAIALLTASVWAAPEGNVYHTIADPTWHVTRIGSRWVIEDSKGFFVGYYVPQAAPAAPAAAPTSTQQTTASAPPAPATGPAASSGNAGGSYYSNSAYGAYNGGYGNYSGYGYNGYGNNGFYGNYGYGNSPYYQPGFNNAHCERQQQAPEPPPKADPPKVIIPIH